MSETESLELLDELLDELGGDEEVLFHITSDFIIENGLESKFRALIAEIKERVSGYMQVQGPTP